MQRSVQVNWNVTEKCNLKCKHCYFSSNNSPELSKEEGLDLLEDIRRSFGKTRVPLGGGEPLLRKDIVDLVSFGSDIGLKLSLATNGLLLSEEKAMELKKAGLNEVLLPIDGVQETHDRIRGKGSFEGVMRAARAARKAGIELVVDPCISKWNLKEIEDILDISEGLGAKGAIFFHFIPLGRGVCFQGELSEEEYVKSLHLLYEGQLQRRLEIRTTQACQYWSLLQRKAKEGFPIPDFFFSSALAPGCRAGIAILCVKPDGNVTPCPNLEISVGNIRKKSLNELWNASLLQKLRKREVGGRCGDCRYKDICGGCRARAFVKYNDPFAEDPLCGFFEKD